MLKVRVFVTDIATVLGSYDKVEIGRASTSADASSQTGTFVSLGNVITLTAGVEAYAYVDTTGASGQFYVSRYVNTGTLATGSWSDPFLGASMGYLTAAEFRDYDLASLTNIDGSAMTDDQLDRHIATSSRLLDGYLNGLSFSLAQDVERHRWRNDTRRIYPYQRPIVSVDALAVYVGAVQHATFQTTDLYVNTSQHWVEVVALSSVTYSLFPAVAQFGLNEPVAELTYTHGYRTIPQDVRDATAITTAEVLGAASLNKQGLAGLQSATIGGYSITRARGSRGGEDHFGLDVPAAARRLVDHYLVLTLR